MPSPPRRHLLRALIAVVAACAGPTRLHAQAISEREIRAAYLFNFIRFTEWPDAAFTSADSPIGLCLFDARDGALEALAPLEGKLVGARALRVRAGATIAEARQCHVVYVAESAIARLPTLRETLGNAPALLIGETEAALDRGAMIAFRVQERRLGFVVNLGATRRAGLRLSPQVLKLALEVRE